MPKMLAKILVFLGKGWQQVFGIGSSTYSENEHARAMVVFQGWLYLGTRGFYGLEIWRSMDGIVWKPCVGPNAMTKEGFGKPAAGTPTNSEALCMIAIADKLYVGTSYGVWYSGDGLTWNKVIGCPAVTITSLASFGGYLYMCSGRQIWRGTWDSPWQPMVGPAPAGIGLGFNSPNVTDITTLAAFGGYLYAGAGRDIPGNGGIEVWRSQDGTNWQLFQSQAGGDRGSLHVWAMAVFSGHLYIGGYHALMLYRTNGTPGHWEDVRDGAEGGYLDGAWSMLPTQDKLYLGLSGADTGKMLWASSNGTLWSPVDTNEIGKRWVCDAIASFKNDLYVATQSANTTIEVWRYTERWDIWRPVRPVIGPPIRLIPAGVRALRNVVVKTYRKIRNVGSV